MFLIYGTSFRLSDPFQSCRSQLSGKSIVITRGASGMGKEMVKAFVAVGPFVTLTGGAKDNVYQLAEGLGVSRSLFKLRCHQMVRSSQTVQDCIGTIPGASLLFPGTDSDTWIWARLITLKTMWDLSGREP